MTPEHRYYKYPRIPDNDYNKARGQARLQIGVILKGFFDMHGLGVGIPPAVELLTDVMEKFAMRVRGKDEPIVLDRPVPNWRDDE
jgi:hypothetical protein